MFFKFDGFSAPVTVGRTIVLPGWSPEIVNQNFVNYLICAILTSRSQHAGAFLATAGRGYLSPLGFVCVYPGLGQ
jgi:hypothetical protein